MNLLRPRSCPCDRPCLSLSLAGLGYTTGFAVPHVRMRISLAFSAVRSIAAVYWASWWPNNAHVRTVPSRPPTRFAMHAYITGAWRMRARAELLVVTPPRLAAGRPACALALHVDVVTVTGMQAPGRPCAPVPVMDAHGARDDARAGVVGSLIVCVVLVPGRGQACLTASS